MTLDDYKIYQKNFFYLQERLEAGDELILLPVKVKDMVGPKGDFAERVTICTKTKEDTIFPHAIMIWANPHELFDPLIIDGEDVDVNKKD